ncbi:MAG: zinc ribbon domain-containing protein [Candidatus Acidiferrales bacterium]
MSDSQNKTRVIPITAWVIAIVAYLVSATVILLFAMPTDPDMSRWPLGGRVAFAYGVFLLLAGFILLIGYVYGDAKRRGMRYVLWTLLAIFIPNGIGIIIYFILREPLPAPCPGCALMVKAGFTFCPHCAAPLKPTCPQCGRAIERGWSHCPNCGASATPGTKISAPGAPPPLAL